MAVHRGDRWKPDEDDRLQKLIDAKASTTLISAKLNRSPEAIRMRLIALRRKRRSAKEKSKP